RHIGAKAQPDRVNQPAPDFGDRILEPDALVGLGPRRPVAVYGLATAAIDAQAGARRQLGDLLEKRSGLLVDRLVAVHEEAADLIGIDRRRAATQRGDEFDLRAEVQAVLVAEQVERFLAKAIARQKEFACRLVINRERPHAFATVERIYAPAIDGGKQHFGVRLGSEAHAL